MKLKSVNESDIETMSYDDIAYVILKEKGSKMKLLDLFNEVCNQLHLNETEADKYIGDFFSLLSTEKRFIQLEGGYWDLRENHTAKIELSDLMDEEDEEELENEELEMDPSEEDMYIDETKDIDDDTSDDEYKDLVVIDDDESEL